MAIYIGDTHGNFDYFKHQIRGTQNVNYKHVGDFWPMNQKDVFARKILDELNRILKRNKSTLYINRGNHDDPRFWLQADEYNLSNIKFVPNMEVLNIEGKIVLFLGGAISVDRLVNPRWFPNEYFDFDENRLSNIMENYSQIDVVISHTAPNFAYPLGVNQFVLDYAKEDSKLVEDITQERRNMGKVYQILSTKFRIKRWVYGHFHYPNTMHYNGTEFTIMAANTFSINQY